MRDISLRQQAFLLSTQASHNFSHDQQANLRGVQNNQNVSLSEQAGNQHQLRRDIQRRVASAGEESAHAVQDLRNGAKSGFLRTEQALVGQDGRIKIRSREVVTSVEDPNHPWWTTSTQKI